jgi:hypothetical protein
MANVGQIVRIGQSLRKVLAWAKNGLCPTFVLENSLVYAGLLPPIRV